MGAPTSTTNGGSTTTTTTNGNNGNYAISNGSTTNGKGVDLFANMPEVSPNLFGHPSDDDSQRPRSRPTRESVLKRLYEALMRRSLTKVRDNDDLI